MIFVEGTDHESLKRGAVLLNAISNIDDPEKAQFTTVATTSERVLSEMELMTADIVKQLAARNAATTAAAAKKK